MEKEIIRYNYTIVDNILKLRLKHLENVLKTSYYKGIPGIIGKFWE